MAPGSYLPRDSLVLQGLVHLFANTSIVSALIHWKTCCGQQFRLLKFIAVVESRNVFISDSQGKAYEMNINQSNTHVLAIVCSVFDAYSAILFLPDGSSESCSLAAYFSLGDKIQKKASILPGKGLAGWILRNRQPLLVPNFDQRQSNLGYYSEGEEAHIKAFMGCPVSTGGILCVDSKRQYSFSDKDHKILQMFAELIAKQQAGAGRESMTNDIPQYFAKLGIIQDLRFRHKRWPVFLQHFLRAVADATGYDYCAFASIDPSGETYTVEGESARVLLDGRDGLTLPLSNGIAGWVFRDERQAVFSEGTSGHTTASLFGKLPDMPSFEAVICLPVVINKTARGVLCLGHTEARTMDEALRSFVHQCVDHLALFLENLYLKNRLRSMLPKARLHSHGPMVYDPDTAPSQPFEDE